MLAKHANSNFSRKLLNLVVRRLVLPCGYYEYQGPRSVSWIVPVLTVSRSWWGQSFQHGECHSVVVRSCLTKAWKFGTASPNTPTWNQHWLGRAFQDLKDGFGQFAKKAGVLPMGLCTCRAPRIPMVYHHIFHDMRSFCKVAFFGQTRLDLLMLTPRSSRRNPITWDASVFASYTLYY